MKLVSSRRLVQLLEALEERGGCTDLATLVRDGVLPRASAVIASQAAARLGLTATEYTPGRGKPRKTICLTPLGRRALQCLRLLTAIEEGELEG